MKTLLLSSVLLISSLNSFAQVQNGGSGPGNSSVSQRSLLEFPKKLSDLPKQTRKKDFYQSIGSPIAVADTLMLQSSVPGPYILRLCILKNKLDKTDRSDARLMLNYRIGDEEILSAEHLANLTNTERGSDFSFCHDTEFSNAKELNGKKIKIEALGMGRDYYLAAIPKEKPSNSWPVLIQADNSAYTVEQTYMVVELFTPEKE